MLSSVPPRGCKSLCYQLPAMALEGVTLVVSPLIALMEEQLASLPPLLQVRSATLSGSDGGSASNVAQALADLRGNRVKLLFLSPERLCSHSFRRLFCGLSPRPLVRPPVPPAPFLPYPSRSFPSLGNLSPNPHPHPHPPCSLR